MDIESKIKERIKKLLSLSESPNEAEAASALAKAKLLLSRYGLNTSELTGNKSGEVNETVIQHGESLAPWEEKLLKCIIRATYTEILKITEEDKLRLVIIGQESNVISAELLFDYLKNAVEQRADLFSESIDDLESFCIGMVESISQKFEKRAEKEIKSAGSRELVSTAERKSKRENLDYIQNVYGQPEESDNWYGVDSNSFGLGKAVGRKISINSQIESE